VGPYLLVSIIEPDWAGRLAGDALFYFAPPLLAFWYAFGPRKHLKDIGERRSLWPDYITKQIGTQRVDYATKALCFVGGLWWFIYLSLPLAADINLVINNDAPFVTIGQVTYTRGTLFISEQVELDSKYPRFEALYFAPRHIVEGNTYEFLYLPKTQLILDARTIIK